MEHHKGFLLRNMRQFADSPSPPTPVRSLQEREDERSTLSPMSGLAQHLGSASLDPGSPRRRLSLCSNAADTPSPTHLHHRLTHELNSSSGPGDTSMCSTTGSPHLFQQAARVSSPPLRSRCPAPRLGGHACSVIDEESLAEKPLSPRNRMDLTKGVSPSQRRTSFDPSEESQDSAIDCPPHPSTFRFAKPLPRQTSSPRKLTPTAPSPRKQQQLRALAALMSPCKDAPLSPTSPRGSRASTGLFHGFSSGSESIDDGFIDFLNIEKENGQGDEDANFPTGLGSLLSGKIMQQQQQVAKPSSPAARAGGSGSRLGGSGGAKRSLHRSLSLADTPTSRAKGCLFKSPSMSAMEVCASPLPSLGVGFKRPEAPREADDLPPTKRRRLKACEEEEEPEKSTSPRVMRSLSDQSGGRPSPLPLGQSSLLNYGFQRIPPSGKAGILQRCHSESEATIKKALQRSDTEPDLIGDFSRPYVLPLIDGKHPDLRSISAGTLASLLRGEFTSQVASFQILDCRYPYEFNGGHVRGARNVFTKEQVKEEYINVVDAPRPTIREDGQQRHVLIFHCEFSSERGPSMSRHLRQLDRTVNKECYPALHYPEIYLVHGGYKAFYEAHPELCEPRAYVPMLQNGHEEDLRHFRSKSRSWAGDLTARNPAAGSSRLAPKFALRRLDSAL